MSSPALVPTSAPAPILIYGGGGADSIPWGFITTVCLFFLIGYFIYKVACGAENVATLGLFSMLTGFCGGGGGGGDNGVQGLFSRFTNSVGGLNMGGLFGGFAPRRQNSSDTVRYSR
jgi:hypothetical protein